MNCTAMRARDPRLLRYLGAAGRAAASTWVGGIKAAFRSSCVAALNALIVALCTLGGARDANAQSLEQDLSGRWTSQRHSYVLDVTRCGAEWCGIKLNADSSCGALALRLAATPSAEPWRQLAGKLILGPTVQTYHITATTRPDATNRPSEIHLLGNPNGPPLPMTRTILFQDKLVRGPDATCTAEGKLS